MSQLALSAPFEYLCYVSIAIIIILFFQCGDRLWTSESDVCRRQILTSKDGPRAERVNGGTSVVDGGPLLKLHWFKVVRLLRIL